MEEFAATLANEVASGYAPHLDQVTTAMLTRVPKGNPAFPELAGFLDRHHEVQQQTFSNTFNFRDGTHHFATAAQTISAEYADTDAYAHAKVNDVTQAFTDASNPLKSEGGVDS
ncbi:Duffy receptor gamma form [Actinoplanes friuliensis DSM 7358]|uniref:Duffy receptor gamma form n=2 Tax=Actinoplanes friuliensis TaxID=196914 RepID=U5WAI2_9ACTN|nr:Duffy receptor gamma form [Actinoplanes friuliensis DSM 7358]